MNVHCLVSRTITLDEPTKKLNLAQPLAYTNAKAHAMQVVVMGEGEVPADLTGIGCTASFKRSDNTTVEPINGTVSGNVAQVILPASCYVIPGRFTFTMDVSDSNGATRTVLWVDGMVEKNTTSDIVDPGTPVGNIEQAIGNANAAASAATTAATNAANAAKYTAPTEASSTASKAYAVGDYFVYNGKLYITTSAIASGGTITPNTNCAEIPNGLSGEVGGLKITVGGISEPYGENIFNPYNYSVGHGINSSTGEETNSSGYNLTDYIDIGTATQITFKLFSYTGTVSFYVAYYSTNDVSGFIRRIGNSSYIPGRTMNLDTGTKYIRIAFENEKNSNGTVNPFGVVVVKGEQTITTYIPYLTALDKKARELPGQYWGAITGTTIASNNKAGTYTVGGYNNTPTSDMTDMPVPDFGGGYLLNTPVGQTGSSIRQDLIEIPTSALRQPRQFTRVGTGAWFGVGYYNWVAYGDSITHGSYSNESGQTLNDSTYSYAWRIAKSIKRDRVNNFYNCAVRGIGWVNTGNNNETLDDMLQLYTGDKDEINLVTVMLGINDYLSLEVIGDENSTEKDGTISGNVRYGLHWICENYPNAKVVVISPLNSTDHGSISTAWSRNLRLNNPHTLQDVSNIIKYWCDVYCVKYINELSEGFINVYNAETILKDEMHPTDEGQWLLAYDLADKIGF